MKTLRIFAWIFFAICIIILCLSTYDTLKTSYYSKDPNSTMVNEQIVQIDKYKIELSENGVSKFKEELSSDFFYTENVKYETYEDFRHLLNRLTKLIEYFDNEVQTNKYPRDNSIIRGVNSVFTYVLRTISKKKEVIAWYDIRSIKKDIAEVRYKIAKLNDPVWELMKFWSSFIIVIIGIYIAKKKENSEYKRKEE